MLLLRIHIACLLVFDMMTVGSNPLFSSAFSFQNGKESQAVAGVLILYCVIGNTVCCVHNDWYYKFSLKNIIASVLIQQYILRKHSIQHDCNYKLNAKHWAYSCISLCTNKEMVNTIDWSCLWIKIQDNFINPLLKLSQLAPSHLPTTHNKTMGIQMKRNDT